jgi:hypothetical protein
MKIKTTKREFDAAGRMINETVFEYDYPLTPEQPSKKPLRVDEKWPYGQIIVGLPQTTQGSYN